MAGVATAGLSSRAENGEHDGSKLEPAQVSTALRAFWADGLFAAASDAFILAYLPLLANALGASATQIGLLAASQSLGSMLSLYPGAFAARRTQSRKMLVVLTAGVGSRLLLLAAALTIAIAHGQTALYLVVVLFSVRAFLGSFILPAWTSLAADVIPPQMRAKYFASRSFAVQSATLAITPLGGLVLDWWGFPGGYITALAASFGLGMLSTIAYSRIPEPPHAEVAARRAPSVSIRSIIANRKFRTFVMATFALQFSTMIAGPFFNVYLKDGLGATNFTIGILTTASAVTALGGQLWFGDMLSRRGPLRVTRLSLFVLPVLPWMWLFVSNPWMVLAPNLIGGAMWAAFNLANFQHLLEATEEGERESYVAFFHMSIFLALFLAPFLGGQVIDHFGYKPAFFISGAGRLVATVMFLFVVAAPREDKGEHGEPVAVPAPATA